MLKNSPVAVSMPATDLDRARKYYSETLGLEEVNSPDPTAVMFKAGEGTMLFLYKRGPTKADHTVAGFKVDNIEAEMEDLRSRGVKFEEYDMPEMNLKTVNGVATLGNTKASWFKDSEGNILSLNQM